MLARVQCTCNGPVSVSVYLSQAGVLSKQVDISSWFLTWRLLSTYLTLCYKEQISIEIQIHPFGTFSQTPDLGKLANAYRLSNVLST